jgi:xanthomonalisin
LFESAPAWQTSALGASVTKRELPDVAFDAASSSGALIVVNGQSNQQIGGTSLASPLFVGLWARIESANNNALGLPTQNMYTYFPKDASPLHDVTSGNNGYNGYGYNAATGYDNATGWGSLDIALFNAYVTKYWGGSSSGGTGGTGGGTFSNSNAMAIGDNVTVTSTIAVSGLSGNGPSTLKVAANISHNWSGDLTIQLIAPDGSTTVLQNPDYNNDGDINTSWTVDASSMPANGTWQLQVIDNDPQYYGDSGTLNSWSLSF